MQGAAVVQGGLSRARRGCAVLPCPALLVVCANLPTFRLVGLLACRLVGKLASWRVSRVRRAGKGRAQGGGALFSPARPLGGGVCQLFDLPTFRLVGKLEIWRGAGGAVSRRGKGKRTQRARARAQGAGSGTSWPCYGGRLRGGSRGEEGGVVFWFTRRVRR